jgi:hypothetical protein
MEQQRNKMGMIKVELINLHSEEVKEKESYFMLKLEKSLQKHGQLKSVIVCEDEDGSIVCLEGRKIVEVAKKLNWEEVLCINVGKKDKHEQVEIIVQMAKEFFLIDYIKAGQMLQMIVDKYTIQEISHTTPFTTDQIEHLTEMLQFDWNEFNEKQQSLPGQTSLF